MKPFLKSFCDFMQDALYNENYGYYGASNNAIGKDGDFLTSSSVGIVWAELWAEIFYQDWLECQQPGHFCIIEAGAGNGIFASDLLQIIKNNFPKLHHALKLLIIEPFDSQKKIQYEIFRKNNNIDKVIYAHDLPSAIKTLSQFKINSAIFFANELLDALPVHRIHFDANRTPNWLEVFTKYENDQFTEVLQEITNPALLKEISLFENKSYFFTTNQNLSFYAEINLQMLNWIKKLADFTYKNNKQNYHCFKKIYIIDYGFYENEIGPHDTLRTYHKHKMGNNFFANIGRQDITSHVDFTRLALELNKKKLPYKITEQGRFLTKNCQNWLINLEKNQSEKIRTKKIRAFQTLTHPIFFGKNFLVLEFPNELI